jgi:2-(1,2-epoxy-1,2-dihydrophenyl)acetyl-CoA isomerase
MDLMLTNRRVGAAEAQAIGLVTEVVDDADLDARVADVTQALADGPTAAYGATKVLLRDSWLAGLDDHLDGEADSIATLAGTPEGREGVAAFLGKREPDFRAC